MLMVDKAGLDLAHSLRGPLLDAFFGGVTWLGSLAVLAPVVALAAVWLWRRGRRAESRFVLIALAGAPLIGMLLKLVVARPRPDLYPALAAVASPLSFPSVHAMQITAAALAAFLALRGKSVSLLLLVLLVGLVALSRVYLQVHHPSDVLAGILLAAGWTWGLRQKLPQKLLRARDPGLGGARNPHEL